MKPRKKSVSHDEVIVAHLKENPEEAVEYLNASLTEEDPRMFLMALRDVTKAFGGMKRAADRSGLNRESLYKALSGKRYPRINNINALLGALGFAIEIKMKSPKTARKRKAVAQVVFPLKR